MRRRAAAALAVAALALGSATTAVAMTASDGGWSHGVAGMMGGGPGGGDGSRWSGQHMGHMSHAVVDSEYEYLVEMIAHHEEAIEAAGELARSDREEMRAFGLRIIESQSAQVDQMQAWLDTWYADRSGDVDYDPMMRDLTQLSGDELDEAFLADMVGHHMGAVMMSQQLLVRDLADHAAVEELADDIRDEQRDEIHTMLQWLRDWFGAGPGLGGMMRR